MNRELIKLEMSRHYWAITDLALRGIVDFVESNESLDFESFHNELEKPSAYFGEQISGSLYSYRTGDTGVMVIDGPIMPRATWLSEISGIASIDVLTDEYKAMLADDTIKQIVLAMDTPGGVSTAISDFATLIKNSSKKTTAFTWMAASAGYWIASAADEIVSPVGGMVGSIGVVMSYHDTSAKDEKSGVKVYKIVSSQSPNKRANPTTDNGRAVVQQLLDDLANGFITQVAENRNVSTETVMNSFGGGAVFAEQRALAAGMIDRVSDFETFMKDKTQPKQLFGFSTNNTKENQMSDENKVVETAAPVAPVVNAKNIAKAERERIQSIESLASMAEGKHPSIVAAVRGTIDSVKFEDGMDKAKAEIHVLKSITAAQEKMITEFEADHKNVNKVAEHVSSANADEQKTKTQAEYDAKTKDLVAAALEANKLKGR